MRQALGAESRTTLVWVALVAATLLSWWLGTEHGVGDQRVVSVAVLVVAFVKVRLIGLHFMELRDAPPVLRAVFEFWCLVVCGGVVGAYLLP